MKSKFSCLLFLFSFLCSCTVSTKIEGYFLLESNFKIVKEYVGDDVVETDKWFERLSSTLSVHADKTYTLDLLFKNDTHYYFEGTYSIKVGKEGHSGSGYFNLNNKEVPLIFFESYFLIFDLPEEYVPDGYDVTRTLYFQRW